MVDPLHRKKYFFDEAGITNKLKHRGYTMTDSHLRGLERRWQETGCEEDEAAWLRERIRSGEVTQEQLVTAAILEHSAARAVLGPEGEALWDIHNSVRGTFKAIVDYDYTLPLRAAARAAGYFLESAPHISEIERLQIYLNALEEYILDPGGRKTSLIVARKNLLSPTQQEQLTGGKTAHKAFLHLSNPNFLWGKDKKAFSLRSFSLPSLASAFKELANALRANNRRSHTNEDISTNAKALTKLTSVAFPEVACYVLGGYEDALSERAKRRRK